jgi:hypothetical protein
MVGYYEGNNSRSCCAVDSVDFNKGVQLLCFQMKGLRTENNDSATSKFIGILFCTYSRL